MTKTQINTIARVVNNISLPQYRALQCMGNSIFIVEGAYGIYFNSDDTVELIDKCVRDSFLTHITKTDKCLLDDTMKSFVPGVSIVLNKSDIDTTTPKFDFLPFCNVDCVVDAKKLKTIFTILGCKTATVTFSRDNTGLRPLTIDANGHKAILLPIRTGRTQIN